MAKRQGRKSAAQTPAPPKERIFGSKKNPKGSAASEKSASKIKLSAQIIKTLEKKLKEFREKYPSKKNVTLADLKAVFRRGAGAYSKSHRPFITGGVPNSRNAWAFARVNKFLKKASGQKVKAAYVQDDDLLKREDGGEVFARGGLIAPNGKKSNLTPEQYKLVRTPQFKEWFGDWENDPKNASKVVDENGEPLVVYHGSTKKFNVFKKSKIGSGGDWMEDATPVFYFSDSVRLSMDYTKDFDLNYVRDYFLNIRKIKKIKAVPLDDESVEKFVRKSKNVYDGYVVKNFDDSMSSGYHESNPNWTGYDEDFLSDVYMVYEPNQIKLADGTNTTFDPNNEDIRYEDGGTTKKERFNNISSNSNVKIFEKRIGRRYQVEFYLKCGEYKNGKAILKNETLFNPYEKISSEDRRWHEEKLGVKKDILRVFELRSLWIDKECRGKGIASQLIEAIIEWAKKNKILWIVSYIKLSDETNLTNEQAYEFLLRHGFKLLESKYSNKVVGIDIRKYKFSKGGSTLLAPNGEPSNLSSEQWHLVRTPQFKAWFGDWENDPENASKVVDENGEPMMVYRGDSSKTNVFKGDVFFSSNDYVAGSYSNKDSIPEYKVFLNIRNPLDLLGGNELRRTPNSFLISGSDPNVVSIFKEAISHLPNDYKVKVGWGIIWDKETLLNSVIKNYEGIDYLDYDNQSASWEAIIKYAKNNGFDGVFMKDESMDKLIQNQFSQITFFPEQIKLADGSNTSFDSTNPDIRYARGGDTNTFYRAEVGHNYEKQKIFIPSGYYEAVGKDGYPIVKYDEYVISQIPEIAASKDIYGAILGAASMTKFSKGLNKQEPIQIYTIHQKPDIDISHWQGADFDYLNEVRYRNNVKGEHFKEYYLNDELYKLIKDFYAYKAWEKEVQYDDQLELDDSLYYIVDMIDDNTFYQTIKKLIDEDLKKYSNGGEIEFEYLREAEREEVEDFFDGEPNEIARWSEGVGRGTTPHTIYTNGIQYLLEREDYGFDDYESKKYYHIKLKESFAKGGLLDKYAFNDTKIGRLVNLSDKEIAKISKTAKKLQKTNQNEPANTLEVKLLNLLVDWVYDSSSKTANALLDKKKIFDKLKKQYPSIFQAPKNKLVYRGLDYKTREYYLEEFFDDLDLSKIIAIKGDFNNNFYLIKKPIKYIPRYNAESWTTNIKTAMGFGEDGVVLVTKTSDNFYMNPDMLNSISSIVQINKEYEVIRIGKNPENVYMMISQRALEDFVDSLKELPSRKVKGLEQYLAKGGEVDPKVLRERWAKKRDALENLANNIQKLKTSLYKDLKQGDEKERLTALVIITMNETGERVGNDDSADNGHFGITGLKKKHVSVNGQKIKFKYTGKSGVEQEKEISNNALATAIKDAIKKSPSDFVFETSDGFRIKNDRVNRYLNQFDISAKDLRGYSANAWIINKLKSIKDKQVLSDKNNRKKKFNEVLKEVAEKVGHGRATLKKHYLLPSLEREFINHGRIVDLSNIKRTYEDGGEIDSDKIQDIIEDLNTYWAKEYDIQTCDINKGECNIYAEQLYDKLLKNGFDKKNIEILSTDDFYDTANEYSKEDETIWKDPNDYGSKKPKGYKWIKNGYHVWVYVNGKHYDSESPHGVKNFYDLSIFKYEEGGEVDSPRSAKQQFATDLQSDIDYQEAKQRAIYDERGRTYGTPNVIINDPYVRKARYKHFKLDDSDINDDDMEFAKGGILKRLAPGFYEGIYKGVKFTITHQDENAYGGKPMWYFQIENGSVDDLFFTKAQTLEAVKYFIDNSSKYEKGGETKEIIALPDTYSQYDRLKEILSNQGYELNKKSMKHGGKTQDEINTGIGVINNTDSDPLDEANDIPYDGEGIFKKGGKITYPEASVKLIKSVNANDILPVFTKEYVDVDDVKEINKLLDDLNIPINVVEYLGSGASGGAYLTTDNHVLKITKNAKEAYSSLIIFKNQENFTTQAEIYNLFVVYELESGTKYYFIEKEYLRPFREYTDSIDMVQYYNDIEMIALSSNNYEDGLENLEELIKDENLDEQEAMVAKQMFDLAFKLEKEARAYGIDLSDNHAGNVGWRNESGEKKLLCFDCAWQGEKSLKKGGTIDLFERWDLLPKNVSNILDEYAEAEGDYDVLEEMLARLEPLGYTFDYGLDYVPFNLRKIKLNKMENHKVGGLITKTSEKNLIPTFVDENIQISNYDDVKEVNKMLKELKLNIKVKKELGEGASGRAFLTDRDTVLKVTDNGDEAYSSYIIMKNQENFKSQAKVYNVFIVMSDKTTLFYIEKELGEVFDGSPKVSRFLEANYTRIRDITRYPKNYNKVQEREIEELINDWEENNDEKVSPRDKRYAYQLLDLFNNIQDDMKRNKIDLRDSHEGNVGFFGNKILCFDCSYRSPKAIKLPYITKGSGSGYSSSMYSSSTASSSDGSDDSDSYSNGGDLSVDGKVYLLDIEENIEYAKGGDIENIEVQQEDKNNIVLSYGEKGYLNLERIPYSSFKVSDFADKEAVIKELAKYGVDKGEKVWSIASVIVAPKYRGQGVASILMNAAIQWAKQNNYKKLFLLVQAQGKGGLTNEQLKEFYSRYKFKELKKTYGMDWMARKLENGGELSQEDKKEIYAKWRKLINMSKSELERFYNSEEGKEAGLTAEEAKEAGIDSGRESARWIMKMKSTKVGDWTPTMWKWAKKQISFVSRMSGNKGKLVDENGKKTRKYLSLLIWGNDPNKKVMGGDIEEPCHVCGMSDAKYNQYASLGEMVDGKRFIYKDSVFGKQGDKVGHIEDRFLIVECMGMGGITDTLNLKVIQSSVPSVLPDTILNRPIRNIINKGREMGSAFGEAIQGNYKKGGELNPDDKQVKNYFEHKSGAAGGLLVGKRHSEGGIQAINKSTGQPLEMEGGEVVITRDAVSDPELVEYNGKKMTKREVLSEINVSGGGVAFADGGAVKPENA